MTARDTNEWDSSDYDDGHSFVFEYGEDVIDLLEPSPDERILDLGCGTGHLTAEIASSGAAVVGLDRSPAMIEQARTEYPDQRFVQADARDFDLEEPVDAVFSNAALHWIDEQDAVLESVTDALRPNGRFVAELGGTGNVQAIVDAVRSELTRRGYESTHPWYFPTVGEYASRLESHGFEVRHARLFDRPTTLDDGENGLEGWIEMFGDELLSPVPESERAAVIDAVEDDLREALFADGTWTADYRRLRVVAVLE
ncbi:methyltransferase domain-containing protein [Salinadaptatus halalkaliphilus]|uniref:Methyltransferase domain-containing protein n=1 Tax=Salinadaptatus halalkaliphilus TaxID=2419781 RepID=A0A4S3TI27_9EURY|nr:methyltransferase domain-containing protein [Salinadaptatus halalkaliphilus]THE63572.1 methyltransferase domain-containing protein [Salinadaptatus halalkaliphilus]